MTLPRSVELEWQREVIERWLVTSGIPLDAHTVLLEMLTGVNEEMGKLRAADSYFDSGTNQQLS